MRDGEFSLADVKNLKYAQRYATKSGIIKTDENFEGIILKGVGADFHWDFVKSCLVEGNVLTLNADTTVAPSNQILVSQTTASRMGLKLNQKFVIHFVNQNKQSQQVFQISGIYKTGLEEYDRQFALVDLRLVQGLLGWSASQVVGYEVFVENLSKMDSTNAEIYQLLPNTLTSETIKEAQPQIFQWLELQDINEGVILSLMLVVGLINMLICLLILILERTNMIGILKTQGASNGMIQEIFVYYGALITFVGLLVGNLLGFGLGYLQKTFGLVTLSEANYYLSVAPISFDLQKILVVNALTLLLIVVTLILPTLLVLRISPVKAIRFK
jgi:lipoprotein-releasing system permease protein